MEGVPVYVINLDKDTEKWEQTRSTIEALGLSPTRFPAVYGKELSKQYLKEITHPYVDYTLKYGRSVDCEISTIGAIGCYLSHVGVWKKLVESDDDMCLVFEDDISPKIDLGKVNTFLKNVMSKEPEWDMIYIGYIKMSLGTHDILKGDYYKVNELTYCTHSYLVNKKGAQKLLKSAFPMIHQVDTYMSLMAVRDLNSYRGTKSFVKQSQISTFFQTNCQDFIISIKMIKPFLNRMSNHTIFILIVLFISLLIYLSIRRR